MANKYLVKALISRSGYPASLRFVPLEIFDLWKSHMIHSHDYQIKAVQVSLWVQASDEIHERMRYAESEPVVGVCLKKKVGSVAMPVERFFAADEVERILPKFLSHYGIDVANPSSMSQVVITKGYFISPEAVFGEES